MQHDYQQNDQSRFLYEELVIDNQPTQDQVIDRMTQLNVHDYQLARQSLTKEMAPYWRPYANRYGDIYYINLNQKKAYVDHPVDMQTQTKYCQKYKKPCPKYKSYKLQQISQSLSIINQQIQKYHKTQPTKGSSSFINQISQLNIVYEQSQGDDQQKFEIKQNLQSYKQSQESQQDYIENLTRNIRQTPRNKVRNQGKRFPKLQQELFYQDKQQDQQDQGLTIQYQRLLFKYQNQLKNKYQTQLLQYKLGKQNNFILKQNTYKSIQKSKIQSYKQSNLAQYQRQIDQKNQINYEKQKQKYQLQRKQKIHKHLQTLQNYEHILNQIKQIQQKKQTFIQKITQTMQKRINYKKYQQIQRLNKQIRQQYLVNKIDQIIKSEQKVFDRQIFPIISQKMIQYLKDNNLINKSSISHFTSRSSLYQHLVKTQLSQISSLLTKNSLQKRMQQSRIQKVNKKRHIPFVIYEQRNKQNISNNLYSQKIKYEIQKSKQDQIEYIKRRTRIFSYQIDNTKQSTQLNQDQRQFKCQHNNDLYITKDYNKINGLLKDRQIYRQRNDRKSMLLRMVKRIL